MKSLPLLLLATAALSAPAQDPPTALSATPLGADAPNQWTLSWHIGEAPDRPHDLLVLAGLEEDAFEVIHRFAEARGRGRGTITLPPEYRWLTLQSATELGGSRLGAPLDLRLAEVPGVDPAEVGKSLVARHREVPVEVHQREPLFPDHTILTIGPTLSEELIVLDLPWTPASPLTFTTWYRVRGQGATVTCRPVSIGGATPAPDNAPAPDPGAEPGWQFLHLDSEGAQPDTTHFRIMIERDPEAAGPVTVEFTDLRLRQAPGPAAPPHARLLGRVPGTPTSMALFEDSSQLVIGFAGSVAIFDPGEQRLIARHPVGQGSLSWVGGAGGQAFAIDATPALWRIEVESGITHRVALLGESAGIAAVSGNGRQLATVDGNHLHLWSLHERGLESHVVKGLTRVESLAFEHATLRITTETRTMIYHPGEDALAVSKIHGQTGFARPVFNHAQGIWTDPKRRKYYTLHSASLEPYPVEAGRPGPAFPASLREMVIRPTDGEVLLADCFGQLWRHPPLPVPAAGP